MLFGRALRYVTSVGSLKLTDARGRIYEFTGNVRSASDSGNAKQPERKPVIAAEH